MSLCPCSSGKEFSDCCEPILAGTAPAATPEALMRARYTAYATGAVDFLRTSSCGVALKEFNTDSVRQWSENSEWQGLEVMSAEDVPADATRGHVEFTARYKIKDHEYVHHEIAEFHHVEGAWKFADSKVIGPEPKRREEPKIGRNDPCPCGSGKKYKKCCGRV